MAANFYELFLSFMFIAIVVFGMFSYAYIYQNENNVEDKFINNAVMNETFGDLRESLEANEPIAQDQKDLFERDTNSGIGFLLFFSVISAGKVFNNMMVGLFNLLIKIPVVFLGLDPVMISIFSVILIFAIIIGVWRVLKGSG